MTGMNTLNKYSLCRLCLCRGDKLTDIFEENNKRDFMIDGTVQDLLRFQVVREVGVSWLACASCLDKLADFRLFKQRCIECKIAFEARASFQGRDVYAEEFCQLSHENPIKEECDHSETSGGNFTYVEANVDMFNGMADEMPIDETFNANLNPIKEECDGNKTSEGVFGDAETNIYSFNDMAGEEPIDDAFNASTNPIRGECDDSKTSGGAFSDTETNICSFNDIANQEPVDRTLNASLVFSKKAVSSHPSSKKKVEGIIFDMDRKRSHVWKLFKIIGPGKAKCLCCSYVYSYKCGTTSNLYRHIRLKHSTFNVHYAAPKGDNGRSYTKAMDETSNKGSIESAQERVLCAPVIKSPNWSSALLVVKCKIGKELRLVCHQKTLTKRVDILPISALTAEQFKLLKENTKIAKLKHGDVICAHHLEQYTMAQEESKEGTNGNTATTIKVKGGATRKKRSNVWKLFESKGKDVAKCRSCKHLYTYKYGTTSNLYRHLRLRHAAQYRRLRKMEKADGIQS